MILQSIQLCMSISQKSEDYGGENINSFLNYKSLVKYLTFFDENAIIGTKLI